MALFGARKRGLFDPPEVYRTPGIGDGQRERMPVGLLGGATAPEEEAGFWGGGKKFGLKEGAAGVLAALGDALMNQAGMQPTAVQGLSGRRDAALDARAKAEAAAAKREQGFEDFRRQYDYERANPKPTNNDTERDYNYILQTLGPEAAKKFLENKADPPQYRQGPDGQFYRISPTAGYMDRHGGGSSMPQGYDPNEWEVVPGPQGGAGPSQAPRRFR